VGTVYRRFRTKEELVEALFEDRVDAVAALAERAAGEPDPWTGLASFMEQMAELLAGDLGLRQLLMFATYGQDRVAYARRRNAPLIQKLVERAQAAGQVRPDLMVTDIPFLVFVLTEAAQIARPTGRDLWRRYLALILDGMRPAREGLTPLPVPALPPEELEKAMRQHAPGIAERFPGAGPHVAGIWLPGRDLHRRLHLQVRVQSVNESPWCNR